MPIERRRHFVSFAASLPRSRLAIGAPPLLASERAFGGCFVPSSPATFFSKHCENGSEDDSSLGLDILFTSDTADMPPPETSGAALAQSIAETKLERQSKRNEEVDAVLKKATGTEQNANSVRTRSKNWKARWKPLDYTAEVPSATSIDDNDMPVSEARVSTFRAQSRDTSLSRSTSVVSHDTSETGAIGRSRQDSTLTDAGYQLYITRKNRKNVAEPSVYERRPEERQTSVEATFDTREIYEVFGNALPAPDYIQANVGVKDGQLQFVQHPNGDISAHQWSEERYVWENIGQFSNIRKKIEGQLGSDRLKGETAQQTLQQHTLAYFRTVARQREAQVMGVPFGLKEIQATMPDARGEVAEPFAASIKPMLATGTSTALPTQPSAATLQTGEPKVSSDLWKKPPLAAPVGPCTEAHDKPSVSHKTRPDDRFYATSPYQQPYIGYQYGQQHFRRPTGPIPCGPLWLNQAAASQAYAYNDLQASANNYNVYDHASQNYLAQHSTPHANVAQYQYGVLGPRAHLEEYPMYAQAHTSWPYAGTPSATGSGVHRDYAVEDHIARSKDSITPHRMSEQLWKISENAKERSLIQTKSRTVLYDPYQQSPAPTSESIDHTGIISSPTPRVPKEDLLQTLLEKAVASDASSSRFFPRPKASQLEHSLPMQSQTVIMPAIGEQPRIHAVDMPLFTKPDVQSPLPSLSTSNVPRATRYRQAQEGSPPGKTTSAEHEGLSGQIVEAPEVDHRVVQSPIAPPSSKQKRNFHDDAPVFDDVLSNLWMSIYRNLSSYAQDSSEDSQDYFCPWSKAPEWCIDRSEDGNKSFFEDYHWASSSPLRDRRTTEQSDQHQERFAQETQSSVGLGSVVGSDAAVGVQIDRRFGLRGKW